MPDTAAPDAAAPDVAAPRATSELRQVLAVTRLEMTSYVRTPGGALFALLMPTGLLLFATWLWYPREVWELAVPDMLVLTILASGLFSVGVAVTQQRVDGTLKTYLSSPLRPRTYLAGQVIDRVLVTLLGSVVMVVVAVLALGIDVPGNLALFFLCGLVCLAAMLSLGFLLASRFTSVETAGGSSSLIFVLVMLASGFFVDPDRFPGWVSTALDVLPFRAVVDVMRTAWLDPGFDGGWGRLALVALWAVVFLAAAARWFRWSASDR